MVETTMIEMAPRGSQNVEKYRISDRYSVIFYTLEGCAIFTYFWDFSGEINTTSRSCALFWISQKEKEKLFAFERKKKEEYIGYEVHGVPEKDEEKPHENNKKINKNKYDEK